MFEYIHQDIKELLATNHTPEYIAASLLRREVFKHWNAIEVLKLIKLITK